MQSINFIALLITPSLSGGYISKLASCVPTLGANWIMYRSQSDEFVPHCIELLSPLNKTLLLNLPFTNLTQILELSTHFGGVHLKSHLIDFITPLRAAYAPDSQKIIGYSAHSIAEVLRALEFGADYCTLSPIFSTPNKPAPLGLEILEQIPCALRSKVIALGGITKEHILLLQNLGFGGFAGISYFAI